MDTCLPTSIASEVEFPRGGGSRAADIAFAWFSESCPVTRDPIALRGRGRDRAGHVVNLC